jgi:hypothetical protein
VKNEQDGPQSHVGIGAGAHPWIVDAQSEHAYPHNAIVPGSGTGETFTETCAMPTGLRALSVPPRTEKGLQIVGAGCRPRSNQDIETVMGHCLTLAERERGALFGKELSSTVNNDVEVVELSPFRKMVPPVRFFRVASKVLFGSHLNLSSRNVSTQLPLSAHVGFE